VISARRGSIRTRLTLWNVAVLALVLATLGTVLSYTTSASLMGTVDRSLEQRARTLAEASRKRYMVVFRSDRRTVTLSDKHPQDITRVLAKLQGWPPPGPLPVKLPLGPTGEIANRIIATKDESFPVPPPSSPLDPRFLALGRKGLKPGAPEPPPFDRVSFAAARDGQALFSTILAPSGERLRIYSLPLPEAGEQPAGVLQVVAPLAETERALGTLKRTLLLLIPIALLAAGAGGAFLADRALRPVRAITGAAARIGSAHLSDRLPVTGDDEFARLAEVLNGMLGRLESAFERQQRFTADASHELRTPVAIIKATASMTLDTPSTPEEYRTALEIVDRAADRTSRIVQDLLLLARSDGHRLHLAWEPSVSLSGVLQEAIDSFACSGEAATAAILLDTPLSPVTVRGDTHHLLRLFVNLLENARRHTPAGGEIVVTLRADTEKATITVADTGEGIPAEHLPLVCERFYRVDNARTRAQGGTGLGLAICRTIAEAHAGRLTIESVVGQGTTVTITLPIAVASDLLQLGLLP